MKPWENLTEDDVNNVKKNGSGCYSFLLGIICSVGITLLILKYYCGISF